MNSNRYSVFGRRPAAVLAALLVLAAVPAFASADLGVSMTDSPDPVRIGNSLTVFLAVTNGGPHTATNVVVTEVMPSSMTFGSCALSQGSYSQVANTVYCNLGNLANGATAGVSIVMSPTVVGVVTNESSVGADNGSGNRASAETTVLTANRPPEISLPGPHVVPVGCSTGFAVTVSDPDHDPLVTITNTAKPSGATYVNSNFSWTATAAFANTTNLIVFVANDGLGETNSVVTNSTTLIVPFDWDADGMSDGWEYSNFVTLTNTATGDHDGDGQDNATEYNAGTQPTNILSKFYVAGVANPAGTSNHQVNVSTVPGKQYTIYFTDSLPTSGVSWQVFANANHGVWIENGAVPTNHIFVDDESTNTTSCKPAAGIRYYRIKARTP